MKRSTRRSVAIALCLAMLGNSMPIYAANVRVGNLPTNASEPVSDRMIVKFKPNPLPRGLSVAQINNELSQPLTANVLAQLQTVAGVAMAEVRSTANGAHVLSIAGQPNRLTLDRAIAGISRLSNVAYVEEDAIATVQAVPNDSFYTTAGGYPGLWGMWPVVPVGAPAPGGTGNYGADFQTAWDTTTGTGVVVAVVDTGITPNYDIVGPNGTVAAGTGSNLVSIGYDFISDCRMRASCAASTDAGSATVAPSSNATDLGDWITAQDKIDNTNWVAVTVHDSTWHGTHVAGTIAAIGNNSRGVIGGAYNAKILPVRVLGKGGGYLADIADGVKWAAGVHATIANPNPAKVINMSLGGSGACGATYQDAINAAVAAGAVVVVAAGNSNMDVANFRPANCANVISVAAISRDGSRATYSNYSSPAGPGAVNVTLAAQGGDYTRVQTFDPGIVSTLNNGTTTPNFTVDASNSYAFYQGTSMATPHAAAAAALILAKNPLLTPAEIKTILSAPSSLSTFPSFAAGSYPVLNSLDCSADGNCGAGILNAKLALDNTPYRSLTSAGAADLGSVLVGSMADRTVTFTNSSQVTVTQSGAITFTGSDFALFSAVAPDTCTGAMIAAGGTCQFSVRYSPVAAGAHLTTLNLPISGAVAATMVGLSGSAGSTTFTTSTPSLTPTTVTVGQSTTVNLSFSNPNADTLRAGAVTLSNPAIMATSSDLCSNATLAASGSCTVTVTVSPAAAGSYTGTASLALSGGGAAAVVTISGSANPAPTPPASSGGGGCSIMPFGATPDASLLLAMLAVGLYWMRRRTVRGRSAD